MNGQMMSSKEKRDIINEFIKRVNPYKESEPLNFDLRGYAKYVKENKIPGDQVPLEVAEKFKL